MRCSEEGSEASLECAEKRPLRLGVEAVTILPIPEALRVGCRRVRGVAGRAECDCCGDEVAGEERRVAVCPADAMVGGGGWSKKETANLYCPFQLFV